MISDGLKNKVKLINTYLILHHYFFISSSDTYGLTINIDNMLF